MKSYYSQTALILFFGLLGWVFMTQQTIESLNLGYWIAAALTPVYFIYRTRKKSEVVSRESEVGSRKW